MKVDLNAILAEDYVPEFGAEYEVTPGKWYKMKPITINLQEEVFAKAEDGLEDDFEALQLILVGGDKLQKNDCLIGMPTRVVADFFTLLSLIVTRLSPSSSASSQSQQEESQEIPG